MDWIVGFAAGTLAALAASAAVWHWWSRLDVKPPYRWSQARVRFVGSQPKGDFGELLTAVILTQQGWRQLPSKIDTHGKGIDGLFIRPHWLTGFEVLLTETKVNVSPFKLHQLADNTLIRLLGDLYTVGELDWSTSAAIIRALKWRSFAVTKEQWHHNLHTGITRVQRASRQGFLTGPIRERDTAALMESIAMMLSAMDRAGHYVVEVRPPTPQESAADRGHRI